MFDYSCCDFCSYDTEYTTMNGTVCENCDALKAQRRLCRMIADLESDRDMEDLADD